MKFLELKSKVKSMIKNDTINRIFRNSFWTFSGSIISRIFTMAATIVITRLLGVVDYGKYAIVLNTVMVIATVLSFGLGMASVKHIAEYKDTNKEKTGRIIALNLKLTFYLSTAFAFITYILSPFISKYVLGDAKLSGILKVSSVYLFFLVFEIVFGFIITGFEKFKEKTYITVVSSVLFCIYVLLLVNLLNLVGAVISLIIFSATTVILSARIVNKQCKEKGIKLDFKNSSTEKKSILTFFFQSTAASFLSLTTEWGLNILLINTPNGFGESGLFNASKQWFNAITFAPVAVQSVTLPMLSNARGNNDKKTYKYLILFNTLLMTGIALLVSVPIMIFSKNIMGLYGKEFLSAQKTLILICIYSILYCGNIVAGQFLWTTGSNNKAVIVSAVRAVLLFMIFLLFTGRSAAGLATAYIYGYIVLSFIHMGIIYQSYKKQLTKQE